MNTPLRRLAAVVVLLFVSLYASTTYIQFVRAEWLDARPGNARTLYKDYGRERQPVVLSNQQIAKSVKVDDAYGYLRQYPEGPLYSAVTGFYSVVYGATGMESAQNSLLSGTADQLFYRRIGDLLTGRPAVGATVELTIAARVQKAAWDALGDRRGAVVALEPSTGRVLAMVNKPAYDPNDLASHDTAAVKDAYTSLIDDPDRPLENRAIGRLYPPGSVFKVVTAAAALSSGDYRPDSEVPGPAELDLPQTSAPLPNDFSGACGPNDRTTLAKALEISCNTAFGAVGLELGGDALREQSARFGFGERLQSPLTVAPSQFPAELTPPQIAQSAIGQYDVRVTPMQVAMVSAAVANRGVVMRPQLVNRVLAQDLSVIERPGPDELGRAVSQDVAADLNEMMQLVVRSGTGTRAAIPGMSVAGKTGTAETGVQGQKPVVWFTGFAPADDPKVAVAVVLDEGEAGGRDAAPIARQVMQAVVSQ